MCIYTTNLPRAKLEHQRHIDAYNMILSRLPEFKVIIDGSLTCDYGTQWEDLLSVVSPNFDRRGNMLKMTLDPADGHE